MYLAFLIQVTITTYLLQFKLQLLSTFGNSSANYYMVQAKCQWQVLVLEQRQGKTLEGFRFG